MPKLRRGLSIILVAWLCIMLITFTYTWVSRNWTPSLTGEDINVASSGALVISILGDDVHSSVSLNDVVGLKVNESFTFRQVSSQDGLTFFRKDFTPTINDEPAQFFRITNNDIQKEDYIDTKFILKLDDRLEQPKYIFIHPETYIKDNIDAPILDKAIRISLTYEKKTVTDYGTQTEEKTVILANLDDNTAVINALGSGAYDDRYRAVSVNATNGMTEDDPAALAYQTVYGLHYFNCGRDPQEFDYANPDSDDNYKFTQDKNKALFRMAPGDTVTVYMRIWLEGQDENCVQEIASETFDMLLKFDSVFVDEG